MEILTLDEFKKRMCKEEEYFDKLLNINCREAEYLRDNVPEGEPEIDFFKTDANGKYYDIVAQTFEDERNALYDEYSIYLNDVATILTEEAIKELNLKSDANIVYSDTQKDIGKKFEEYENGVLTEFIVKHLLITLDGNYLLCAESTKTGNQKYIECTTFE